MLLVLLSTTAPFMENKNNVLFIAGEGVSERREFALVSAAYVLGLV